MIAPGDRGRIQQLPPLLVNQIAAGEVIERPASVVKELLENSVDAGAVNIRIELEEGGKRLIRITDDGLGIAADDLPLAVASHATSKLLREEDLHSIRTLGFRGEALASIASVSEVEILSRPVGAATAEAIRSAGGQTGPARPEALQPGTRITVRNLFSTVPARRRFLKSDRAELSRITTAIQHVALAIPGLGVSVAHHGKTVLRYPSGQTHEERIREVLGPKISQELLELPADRPQLRGWVGRPDLSRRTTDAIYVFLNGRFVRDKVVIHALRQAYQGFQIPGHHPVAVLYLSVEPAEVDVNVHPAKLEVRFRDSGRVHSLIHGVVRARLEAEGSVPSALGNRPVTPVGGFPAGSAPPAGSTVGIGPWVGPRPAEPAASGAWTAGERQPAEPVVGEPQTTLFGSREARIFQVNNAYLVVEEESGLTIIDQHALHEKILYEEILEARGCGELRQPLLIPETLELTGEEWEILERVGPALRELGFELEEFGDRTIIVRALPAGYDQLNIATFLRDVMSRMSDATPGTESQVELRQHLVATIACKRAVKAGQRLSERQQIDLIRGRERAFQPQNCPHGRPSELFIGWDELDRRFDRK